MNPDPYLLITADTHAGGSHAQYREYLEPRYQMAFDEWRTAAQESRGQEKASDKPITNPRKLRNWDLDLRTRDQNSQGVVGEVVFPNTVPPFYSESVVTSQPPRPEQFEHALAGVRAHNRWLKDFCAEDPLRRAGIGCLLYTSPSPRDS